MFRFIQPAPHPSERLPARLQFAPGLRVAQEVAERTLAPAQHPLGKNGLRYAVLLQLGIHLCNESAHVKSY